MIRSFKVRLFPNQKQEELFWKHINGSRFVWNYGLEHHIKRYHNGETRISGFNLRKVFTKLKKQDEYSWLNELSGHTIAIICIDLDKAYKRFFNKVSNKPKFKKKSKTKKSFPVRQDVFYFKDNCATIEKIGKVKCQTDYDFPQGRMACKFSNPRIQYLDNKWILTIGMECENQVQKLNDYSMGIDLGINKLAVVRYSENNLVFKNINKAPRVKKLSAKLKHLQRNCARKYNTNNKSCRYEERYFKSNGILKTEEKIRKIHNTLSNIRENHLHQVTHKLVELLPHRVVMEDLNVQGMIKNKHLSRVIIEQRFSEFIRQMEYKCEDRGIEFIQADRWFPSSKKCSQCGYKKSNLKLKDRVYRCEKCGLIIDRDENAAINLMNYSDV